MRSTRSLEAGLLIELLLRRRRAGRETVGRRRVGRLLLARLASELGLLVRARLLGRLLLLGRARRLRWVLVRVLHSGASSRLHNEHGSRRLVAAI